jgi:hypothetical protein
MKPQFKVEQDANGQYQVTVCMLQDNEPTEHIVHCNTLENVLLYLSVIYGSVPVYEGEVAS